MQIKQCILSDQVIPFSKLNYNLAECLGGQIGGVPPLANRVEKLVCLEIIVARILNLYIGNVSERQSDSPIKAKSST